MRLRGEDHEDPILQLLARAGVAREPLPSTGMLSTERILVFRGEWQKSLSIYGQDGSAIGSAVRVADDYKRVGFGYHYELRDFELQWVFRDVTRRRFGLDRFSSVYDPDPYAFTVLGADANEIGTITQSGSSSDRYEIASGGRLIGRVRGTRYLERIRKGRPLTGAMPLSDRAKGLYDRLRSRVWHVEDEPGHSVAAISYIAPLLTRDVTYVLELGPRLDDHLRTMALTVCLIADNRIIDHSAGGG